MAERHKGVLDNSLLNLHVFKDVKNANNGIINNSDKATSAARHYFLDKQALK